MVKLTSNDRNHINDIIGKLNTYITDKTVIELETVIYKNKWDMNEMRRLCSVLDKSCKSKESKYYFQLSCDSQSDSNIRYRILIDENVTSYLQETNASLFGSMKNLFKVCLNRGDDVCIKTLIPELFFQQNDYYFYIRSSTERVEKLPEKNEITENDLGCVGRLITRNSFVLAKTKSYCIKVDCSEVTQIMNLSDLASKPQTYEVEIDIEIAKQLTKQDQETISKSIISVTDLILKVFQNSHRIITKIEMDAFVRGFSHLIEPKNHNALYKIAHSKATYLPKYNMLSQLTNVISNNYLTFGFQINRSYVVLLDKVYCFNSENEIYCVDIVVPDEYQHTVLYGEIKKYKGKNTFWMEDVLILKGQSQLSKTTFSKTILSLTTRLLTLSKISSAVFGVDIPNLMGEPENFKTKSEYKSAVKKSLVGYWKDVDKVIKKASMSTISFLPKFFIEPKIILSTKSTSDDIIWCNIMLLLDNSPKDVEGICYVPLKHQTSTKTVIDVPHTQMWFKEKQNIRVDFHIEFVKNPDGAPTLMFDKTISDNTFVSAALYTNNIEYTKMIKTIYMESLQVFDCHIDVNDNSFPHTPDGAVIRDKDIVTFELRMDNHFNKKWVPIQIVNRGTYRCRYGDDTMFLRSCLNYRDCISLEQIKSLTNSKSNKDYWTRIRGLKNGPGVNEKANTSSNEVQSIVNSLMTRATRTYLLPKFNHKLNKYSRRKVLEVNFNNGTMFPLYFGAMVNKVTAIDVNEKNIMNSNSKINQLISETKNLSSPLFAFENKTKRTKPPIINTAMSDISIPLKFSEQKKVFNLATNDVDKYFNKTHSYNVVMCNFTLGQVLKDSKTLDNFMLNLNCQLAENGHLITIDFDGNALCDLFQKRGSTTEIKHKNKSLLRLQSKSKVFDTEHKNITTGMAYTVENNLMEQTMEYSSNVINYTWFDKIIEKKSSMICVETNLLSNIFPSFKSEYGILRRMNMDLHDSFKIGDILSFLNKKDGEEVGEIDDVLKDVLGLIRYSVYQKVTNKTEVNDEIIVL